jgi:hypothetical protein
MRRPYGSQADAKGECDRPAKERQGARSFRADAQQAER